MATFTRWCAPGDMPKSWTSSMCESHVSGCQLALWPVVKAHATPVAVRPAATCGFSDTYAGSSTGTNSKRPVCAYTTSTRAARPTATRAGICHVRTGDGGGVAGRAASRAEKDRRRRDTSEIITGSVRRYAGTHGTCVPCVPCVPAYLRTTYLGPLGNARGRSSDDDGRRRRHRVAVGEET